MPGTFVPNIHPLTVLTNMMDEAPLALVREGLADGSLELLEDHSFPGVWAILAGQRAVVVIYTREPRGGDFETSDDFELLLAADHG